MGCDNDPHRAPSPGGLSLRTSQAAEGPNPNGIPSFSPGLRVARYPGKGVKNLLNPNGVASGLPHRNTTLAGLKTMNRRRPGVAPGAQRRADLSNPVGLAEKRPRLVRNDKPGGEGRGEGERHPITISRCIPPKSPA